ncbi:MAG: hypothetical protein AAFU79_14960 [Myxococcota bacterium]
MATRAKKKTTKKTTRAKKAAAKKAPARAAKKAPAKKAAAKKTAAKAPAAKKATKPKKFPPVKTSSALTPKASRAVKAAADALWDVGVTPHVLLKELHEVLLLRCLSEAQGNYASAAKLFGPSRQSVQQYANSTLRDERWAPYQQNQRSG